MVIYKYNNIIIIIIIHTKASAAAPRQQPSISSQSRMVLAIVSAGLRETGVAD